MGRRKRKVNKAPNTMDNILSNKVEVLSAKKALDAYSNLAANLGAGANNLAQTAGYVMQRFTWDYYTINILFRDNWIAKAIVEKPANEMLKNGFEIQSELDPDKVTKIMQTYRRTQTQPKFRECLIWSRLYGGCLLIPMLEGQEDLSKPLDFDSIMPDSYKGCFTIDRWCGVSPSLELIDDISDPEFGQPKYYIITAPQFDGEIKVHHSRVIKMIGRRLPYWEEIAETYWGASELEHVYTELKKRDDTSANISFLIFLANIRVFGMEGLGQAITIGDQESLQKVYETVQNINRLMCNTGIMAMDKDDTFNTQQYTFAGINDIYESFMLDISGAAEIPVDKLFGRSPAGFNAGNETLQNYYDTIQEKQETDVRYPLEKLLKIITMSALGEIPDDFEIVFNPIRRPSDLEKSDLGQKNTQAVLEAYQANVVGKGTVLREFKEQSPLSGMWSNITDEMIKEADAEDEEAKKQEKEEQKELELGMNKAIESSENNVQQVAAKNTEKKEL